MPDDSSHTESTADWQVTPLRADTVEVAGPGQVKYVFEAAPGNLTIEAFENNELVESNRLMRGIHEFILEAADSTGLRMRLIIAPAKETITTRVLDNNDDFLLESPAGEHALLLHRELNKKRVPGNQRIQRLADELRSNQTLVDAVKRNTRYGTAVLKAEGIKNTTNAACVVACFLCSLGSYIYCVACAICIETVV
jgi:hypothetical protein